MINWPFTHLSPSEKYRLLLERKLSRRFKGHRIEVVRIPPPPSLLASGFASLSDPNEVACIRVDGDVMPKLGEQNQIRQAMPDSPEHHQIAWVLLNQAAEAMKMPEVKDDYLVDPVAEELQEYLRTKPEAPSL